MSADQTNPMPDRVRADALQPGDQIRHQRDWTLFTVSSVETLDSLGSPLDFHNRTTGEMERGLRVTGTDADGETVHVDCAPSYLWHREGRQATAPMTPDRLAAILARATAATPGRWESDGAEIYGTLGDVLMIDLWVGETLDIDNQEQSNANAAFIAAARTDVPELVAEVQRLRAQAAGQNDPVHELSAAEQQFLRFALELAADQMAEHGDEFDADDDAALESLRRLTGGAA